MKKCCFKELTFLWIELEAGIFYKTTGPKILFDINFNLIHSAVPEKKKNCLDRQTDEQ